MKHVWMLTLLAQILLIGYVQGMDENLLKLDEKENLCTICLEELDNNDGYPEIDEEELLESCDRLGTNSENLRTGHKQHRFHEDCIKEWLKEKLTCPLCKVTLQQNNQFARAEVKFMIAMKCLHLAILLLLPPMAVFSVMTFEAVVQRVAIAINTPLSQRLGPSALTFVIAGFIGFLIPPKEMLYSIISCMIFHNVNMAVCGSITLLVGFYIDFFKERRNGSNMLSLFMNFASIVLGNLGSSSEARVDMIQPILANLINFAYAILIDVFPNIRINGLIILSLFTTALLTLDHYNHQPLQNGESSVIFAFFNESSLSAIALAVSIRVFIKIGSMCIRCICSLS